MGCGVMRQRESNWTALSSHLYKVSYVLVIMIDSSVNVMFSQIALIIFSTIIVA